MDIETPARKTELISDKKFLKFFDINYKEGAHYYAVSRRDLNESFAVMDDIDAKTALPDAVTVIPVITPAGSGTPRLVLTYEYRYPVGRFLLSPPAGLIDKKDKAGAGKKLSAILADANENKYGRLKKLTESICFKTAARELREETGLDAKNAVFTLLSPLCFSSPGMSDESNALVLCRIDNADLTELSQKGAEGTELFNGFLLLTIEEAEQILGEGRDPGGNYFSVYTYVALKEFISMTEYLND